MARASLFEVSTRPSEQNHRHRVCSRKVNIVLWILQVILGIFFVLHAYLMLRPSPKRLQSGMNYILEMPAALRWFTGVAEGLAGLALVFSPLVHPLALLAPVAAVGLLIVMLGAIVFHVMRREYPNIGLNAFLGLLAALVVWGRFGPYHF
jgi:uncharacterized membrane protein YphA (DoxX/SURF4 family)